MQMSNCTLDEFFAHEAKLEQFDNIRNKLHVIQIDILMYISEYNNNHDEIASTSFIYDYYAEKLFKTCTSFKEMMSKLYQLNTWHVRVNELVELELLERIDKDKSKGRGTGIILTDKAKRFIQHR